MLRWALLLCGILVASCARYGVSPAKISHDSGPGGLDKSAPLDRASPADGSLPRDLHLGDLRLDGAMDRPVDWPVDLPGGGSIDKTMDLHTQPTVDLAPDAPQDNIMPLQNTGNDSLNSGASGSLTWSACASSFTGEVVLQGLAIGHIYQLKLELDWTTDHQAGQSMSSMGRTWDATIWELGDVNNLLPAPHTGAEPGDEPAANIGDYLSMVEQEALFSAGHDIFGYLMFAFLTVLDAQNGEFSEDDADPSTAIVAQAGGFHLNFFADFSWHTSVVKQVGFITFPADQYTARFVITRESGDWPSPLIVEGVAFTVGACP